MPAKESTSSITKPTDNRHRTKVLVRKIPARKQQQNGAHQAWGHTTGFLAPKSDPATE
jgi:hypothetical protein